MPKLFICNHSTCSKYKGSNMDLFPSDSHQVCIGVDQNWPELQQYQKETRYEWYKGCVWIRFDRELDIPIKEFEVVWKEFDDRGKPVFTADTYLSVYTEQIKPFLLAKVDFLKKHFGCEVWLDDSKSDYKEYLGKMDRSTLINKS